MILKRQSGHKPISVFCDRLGHRRLAVKYASYFFGALLMAYAFAPAVRAQNTTRKGLKPLKELPKAPAEKVRNLNDTITDSHKIEKFVELSDYQKTLASRTESVFITNLSATDTIKSLTVEIDYRTPRGKQLNRRNVTFNVTIPPGETRATHTQSWDRQQNYYYKKTAPRRPSERSRPFDITITPIMLIMSHSEF